MKKTNILSLALMLLCGISPSFALSRAEAQRYLASHNLATRLQGARHIDTRALGLPSITPARSLAQYAASQPRQRSASYTWQTMQGQATFHDDFGKAEFNLQPVDYKTGILKATNAADVYALRPYGTTYPYYPDLLESKMVNTNAGAMIVEAADYSYVSMPMFVTGVTITWDDGTTEDIHMASLNWVMEFIGHDRSIVKQSGLGGLNESGHIYFPCTESIVYTTPSILSAAEQAGDILKGFYACDLDGQWGFCLPGVDPGTIAADNAIELSMPQYCFDNNKVVVHMKAGKNIKVFKYGFYSAYSEDIFDDIIKNGSGGEYLAEGDVNLDMQGKAVGNCHSYFGVVAGDAQGNIKDSDVLELYIVPDDDDAWGPKEGGLLTDGIVAPMYTDFQVHSYPVDYQRDKNNPDYIRVRNPYAASSQWPHASSVLPFGHHNHHHYIYINATDHSAVVLETSPLGLLLDEGEGEAKVSSLAAFHMDINGKSLADVKQAGYTGKVGKNADGKDEITFPARTLLYANCKYNNGEYYLTNKNGEFSLVLNHHMSVDASPDDAAAPVYYNLQGIPVAHPELAPGIYIMRRPGSSPVKVYVK